MSAPKEELNIREIFSLIAEKENFVNYDLEFLPGTKAGENFSAIIVFAKIKGIKQDNSYAILNVFLKYSPQAEALRKILSVEKTFKNETVMYYTIFPTLFKLQDGVGMDSEERFKIPRILQASCHDHKEFVALENIKIDGFQKTDHLKPLDYNHLKLLIKKIANFHGTVFAFKSLERKKYEELVKKISEDVFYVLGVNQNLVLYVIEGMKNAKKFIENPEEIGAIDNILDNFPKLMDYLTSRKAAEPYDVICHGDLWLTNIWFKYENNVPKDVCFFDWQIIRCGSLFTDLHYMMFLCTDGEARKKYHSAAFDWYYSDLGDVLRKFGLDVADIYPRDAFKADERKFAPFALAIAVSYSVTMTADPHNVPDVTECTSGDIDKIRKQLDKLSNKGKQRIKEIIADFVSYGYYQ